MRLQRLVAVLLIFTLFIAVIGCSASGTGTKDGSITSADDTSKSDETANDASLRKNAKDSLPDNLDFDGAKFVIMTRSESPYYEEFTAEINGEIVNDTVYKRNLTAAERLHVSIGTIAVTGNWPNAGNFQDKVRSTVLSGTTDYHAIAEYTEGINSLWYEGMLMDFNDIEYIDFSQPWWNQSIINEFTIGGRLYFLSGELALSLMSHSIVLFYNQRIAKDYSINNLYDLVLNGTWSFDEMCGMIKMDSL
jgi:hypothetical protein